MGLIPLIVVGLIAVALAVTSVVLSKQVSRWRLESDAHQNALRAARSQSEHLQLQSGQATFELQQLQQRSAQLQDQVSRLQEEDRKKTEWLDNQEKEVEWLRTELEKRPKILRKTYKILTLGISGTGKTALTLKWANPLIDLGTLQGTKIERYERTVSHVPAKDVTIEHVFEVGDWGGEHIVDAQQELIVEEIHGLLMVVDLAGKEAKAVDPSRIQLQLREFQPEALKFFFGPKTIASCKTVVLFINKADVIAGTPADVEREARALYKRLIDDLEKYRTNLDVRVLVGSATYGHSTHHLFSHFVERILPKNAYDSQLLQRMKSDAMAADLAVASYSAPLVSTQQIGGRGQPGGASGGGMSGAPAAPAALPPGNGYPPPPAMAPTPPQRPGSGTVPHIAPPRRPDGKR